MPCGCAKPETSPNWTNLPNTAQKNPQTPDEPQVDDVKLTEEFNRPTSILPGENIDCYAKRAGTSGKNDVAEKEENRIDNLSVTSDTNGFVSETFRLTPNSTDTAASWQLLINGQVQPSGNTSIPNLSFNSSTGSLSGEVTDDYLNKSYKILIKALDSSGSEIDSREFNFTPKKSSKEETVKFVFPYSPSGRVTCGFGPRKPPAPGASSIHKGIDISQPGNQLGDILSAADGIVVKCGPARGFGNWIMIEHRDGNGRLVATSVYGHMNEYYVKVGQKVSAGQKIAKEGNAGIGSAAHLHFEIHKGTWGNPVDPIPYINGNFSIAQNNKPGEYGVPDETTFSTVQNSNKGMTQKEQQTADCPNVLENQSGDPNQPQLGDEPAMLNQDNLNAPQSVMDDINRAFDEDGTLTDEDRKFLLFMSKIESNFNPSAKNPNSSARGLYQMIDRIAVKYYGIIGIPPTESNRNNAYYATKAQIEFYKRELKRYWDDYELSGKTSLGGKTLRSDLANRYSSLNQNEFIYGLLHHDGLGNAIAGKDMQGVDYYRRKVREFA